MVRRIALSPFPFVALAALISACETEESAAPPEVPVAVGSCVYTNPFSGAEECKLYVGSTFDAATAAKDCEAYVLGAPGTFTEGGACDYEAYLGTCTVAADTEYEYVLVSPGEDSSACASSKMGCETFAQGTFNPGPTCDGVVNGGGGATGGSVFEQPYQTCRDPLAGEPAGQSAGGKVCTWTMISASTEEGRHYEDYASCEDVLTQRPYYAAPVAGTTPANDPRLSDSAFLAEVQWAREQVEASACVCCHSDRVAPKGPSQWFVEADGIWLDSISDNGLAMMAGLADSSAFGAYAPEDNNGFDRTVLGVPTKDNDRMRALLTAEWERRGYTLADAQSIPPFGGPLVSQRDYQPGACGDGEGQDALGKLVWSGGPARYLYILDAGSANPGVPPNLDIPSGTRWFADVPSAEAPFASGVAYGQLAGKMRKRAPAAEPAALVSGQSYTLYVLADIAVPLARCVFTAK